MSNVKSNYMKNANFIVENRYLTNKESMSETAVSNTSDVVKLAKDIFLFIISIKPGITDLARLVRELVKNPTEPVTVIKNFIINYKNQLGNKYDEIIRGLDKVGTNAKQFYDEFNKLMIDYVKKGGFINI